MRVFLADMSKLRRPLTLWLTLVTVAVSILFAAMGHSQANNSRQAAINSVAEAEQAVARLSDPQNEQMLAGDPEDRRAAREDYLRVMREQLDQTIEESGLSVATQGPLGALGIALGMICSLVGAFVILVAASGHVAGEWTGMTIKETLIADRRRGMTIVAKVVSMFLLGIWLLVCSWIGVTVWGLVSKQIYSLNAAASTSEVFDWIGPMLWKAPLAILFFVGLAIALSVAIRNSVGTLFGGAVALGGLIIMMQFKSVDRFSPAAWLASWMDFQPRPSLNDHLWPNMLADLAGTENVAKVPHWSWGTNSLALAALTVVLIVAAVLIMRRRDALS
jgi:hypothetical protein